MLYDVGLGGLSDEERYRATLHRVADAIGYTVGELLNPDDMQGDLAQTAELLRLWRGVETGTRRAVIEHLRVAKRAA